MIAATIVIRRRAAGLLGRVSEFILHRPEVDSGDEADSFLVVGCGGTLALDDLEAARVLAAPDFLVDNPLPGRIV
jgi:hypothetical protein